jgi:hypothetical protein
MAITSIILGKISSVLADRFTSSVIHRWTRFRAEQFFLAFAAEVQSEVFQRIPNEKVDEMLEQIMADDIRTEVLFESYRRVCLAASKRIGPRIIGYLTAHLVAARREANESDEKILMAAEALSDSELKDFCDWFKTTREEATSAKPDTSTGYCLCHGILEIPLHRESWDPNQGSEMEISPIDFAEMLGTWALKMKNLGIMKEKIVERTKKYRADGKYVAEDGVQRTIEWRVLISEDFSRLAELATRIEDVDPSNNRVEVTE